jgi:nucleotide-binding universal stress UspA family protein
MQVKDVLPEVAFNRILFATDLCPTSEAAATYAAALARRYSANLEITNVIDLSITVPSIDTIMQPALETIRHATEVGLQRLAIDLYGVKVKTNVIEGFLPADLILCEALKSTADLIVVGTSSRRGLKRLLLGSIAEEVIRKAPCPVLTVGPHVHPASAEPLSFRRIIYATDFTPQAVKAAKYAVALSQDLGADLYLVHVVSPAEEMEHYSPSAISAASLRRIIPESAYDWCNPKCVVEHGEAAHAILSLAARVEADLIVLGARKASFWLSYVKPGLTPALIAEARCPVLTIC